MLQLSSLLQQCAIKVSGVIIQLSTPGTGVVCPNALYKHTLSDEEFHTSTSL